MFLTDLMERGDMQTEACDLADRAVVVKVQNVMDYIAQTPDMIYSFGSFPNVASPFPCLWMEWNQALIDNAKCRSGLLVVMMETRDCKGYVPEWMKRMDEEPRWICTGLLFGEIEGKFCGTVKIRWAVGKEGEPVKNGIMIEGNNGLSDEALQQAASFLTVPWMALSFMHCKNVKLEKSPPIPDALRKARERKGAVPLVRFHTLTIGPAKEVIRNVGGMSKGTVSPSSLHFCRGHFKDFTMHGLFGKNKGIYWWPMFARGKKEIGIVLKDYAVAVKA